jgi:TPR repeat protein
MNREERRKLESLKSREGARAQFNMGAAYARGQGVEQDNEQAIYWFRLAAKNGHPEAQFNMGYSYSKGHGIPRSVIY